MQVISIAECSKGSILQYFRPALNYHVALRPLFCLLLSGRLRQVLLYSQGLGQVKFKAGIQDISRNVEIMVVMDVTRLS